jgi:uncharacterized membrane protein YphA (DoxX/SURF4 family)
VSNRLGGPSPVRVAESIVLLLPLRLALGGLFVFAAYLKLKDPQEFVFSIKAFDLLDPVSQDYIIKLLGFAIPWAEMLVGLALLLGFWTRGAATLLAVQLVAFTLGILKVIAEGKEIKCGCFGDYEWPCSSPIQWCHVARNATLLAVSLLLAWRGAGVVSVESAQARAAQARRAALDADSEPT